MIGNPIFWQHLFSCRETNDFFEQWQAFPARKRWVTRRDLSQHQRKKRSFCFFGLLDDSGRHLWIHSDCRLPWTTVGFWTDSCAWVASRAIQPRVLGSHAGVPALTQGRLFSIHCGNQVCSTWLNHYQRATHEIIFFLFCSPIRKERLQEGIGR